MTLVLSGGIYSGRQRVKAGAIYHRSDRYV
jgi:hypothetical protein